MAHEADRGFEACKAYVGGNSYDTGPYDDPFAGLILPACSPYVINAVHNLSSSGFYISITGLPSAGTLIFIVADEIQCRFITSDQGVV
jgi:hypothetical protein